MIAASEDDRHQYSRWRWLSPDVGGTGSRPQSTDNEEQVLTSPNLVILFIYLSIPNVRELFNFFVFLKHIPLIVDNLLLALILFSISCLCWVVCVWICNIHRLLSFFCRKWPMIAPVRHDCYTLLIGITKRAVWVVCFFVVVDFDWKKNWISCVCWLKFYCELFDFFFFCWFWLMKNVML